MSTRTVRRTTHGQHMLDRLHGRTGTGWTHITDLPAGQKYARIVTSTTELVAMRSGRTGNSDRPEPWRWIVVEHGRHARTGTADTARDAMTAADRNVPGAASTTIEFDYETIR